MSFDIASFITTGALANAGTLTVNYPTGRTRGSYGVGNNLKHVLVVGQNVYNAPANFTLAFNANASNITLTNTNMGVIAAGTDCILQIERSDANDTIASRVLPPAPADDRAKLGRAFIIDLGSPFALSTNGLSASQSVAAAASFLLNGTGTDVTANADGSRTLQTARNITAAWTTTAILTITGVDIFGNVMSEVSASGTSHTGKKAFKTITSIASSASITSATVGYGDVLGLPVAIRNAAQIVSEIANQVNVGGCPQKVRLPYYLNQVDLLAGTTNSQPIIAPFAGTVTRIGTQVGVAIGTGGTIVVRNAAGTTVAGSTVTIANSAVQNAQQQVTPTAGDATAVVAKGDALRVTPASFATSGSVGGYVELTPAENALVSGTLVIGEVLKATTTTGDVRGTYAPEIATDGTTGYVLIAFVPDPSDVGHTQA